MFGFFKKKKKTKIQQLIAERGYEEAVVLLAGSIIETLPNRAAAYEFILQELDGASMGNENSKRAATNSGIPPNQYKGMLNKDIPSIQHAQVHIINYSAQLVDDQKMMAKCRIDIGVEIMKHFEFGCFSQSFGTFEPPTFGNNEDDTSLNFIVNETSKIKLSAAEIIISLVREQGEAVPLDKMLMLVENVSSNIGEQNVSKAGNKVLAISALTNVTAYCIDQDDIKMANVYFQCVMAAFDKYVKGQQESFNDYQRAALRTIMDEYRAVMNELQDANKKVPTAL